MKKQLYTTLFFSFLCYASLIASHNRAGEITFEAVGQFTYKATVHTYTKTSSVAPDRDSLQICWGDGNCEYVLRANGNGIELPNDIKYNQYIAVHTYSSFGDYMVTMSDPNRNGGIININAPTSDNVQFHIESQLVLSAETNNSPVLLAPPVDIAFTNTLFLHTPNAFDFEGDSIAYELITPKDGLNSIVPNYLFPNEIDPGPLNNLSLDEQTGVIRWDSPVREGEYAIAILIKEYRDGALISTVVRDMQILVKLGQQPPPGIVLNPNPLSIMQPGDILDIAIEAQANSNLLLSATGGPFAVIEQPAVFSAFGDFQASPATANLRWEITDSHKRDQPYQIVIKAEDTFNAFNLYVFQITIDNSNSAPEFIPQGQIQVFPNPATDQLWLTWESLQLKDPVQISIYDLQGRLLQQRAAAATAVREQLDISKLPSGPYMLTLSSGEFRISQQLIKD